MKNKIKLLVSVILLILLGSAVAIFTHNHTISNKNLKLLSGTYLYDKSYALPEFTLVNHRNHSFTNKDLANKWSFLFFGYTHCPDICPITLTTLNEVTKNINNRQVNANTQVLFVSVDEQRDTPDNLSKYVTYFNPSFIGLSGNKDVITALTKNIGAVFSISKPTANKDYIVDHSAVIYLINPNAQVVAVFSAPHDASSVTEDFLSILRTTSG